MSAPELISGYVVAGKFTVRSILRHGGTMATYRAAAPKNREVALKLYDPAILSFPDVVKTLAQHRSISAKLPAEQIVPIIDSGTDTNSGAPFTVTDFEAAPSLAQLIERGPLTATQMVALVHSLARVTDLLHSNGVTSLSLHPSNVFVRPGGQYEVRIADFGSSLVRGALPTPEKAARWMPWLAPEQIKGQGPVTSAADVFALGLMAFFAVTGKPYWRSSQQKVSDTAPLRREILAERMPASVRANEFSISLNPAVDAVFARALAFRPTDRHSTAREFAAALEAALSGRAVADSSADAAPATGRMAAPPPRKMPRSTMLGMGSPSPLTPNAAAVGVRPPMNTIVGIGESADPPLAAPPKATAAGKAPAASPAKVTPPPMPAAPAKVAAAANASPPALPTAAAMPASAMTTVSAMNAPAKTAAPAMTAAPAKTPARPAGSTTAVFTAPVIAVAPAAARAPAMPAAPAVSAAPPMPMAPVVAAEPPMAAPEANAGRRGGPPPLPIAPPPAHAEQALARFEASAPELVPAAVSSTSSMAADVAQARPAWSMPQSGDAGAERVETGVAVLGADSAPKGKSSRMRWIASICGLVALTGGAAFALAGRSTGSHAESNAKPTSAAAAKTAPISAEPAAPPPAAPATQEPEAPTPAPTPPPPAAAPPPAPADDGTAAAPAPMVPARSAPGSTLPPQNAPAAPHAQPSKKPCGKFLKRCK